MYKSKVITSKLSQSLFIFIQFKCKQMLYPWVKFLSEEIWSGYSAPNPGFHKGMFAIFLSFMWFSITILHEFQTRRRRLCLFRYRWPFATPARPKGSWGTRAPFI